MSTTDRLVNDILDGLFTQLLDHVEAGHIEHLAADLARIRVWAEGRYEAMITLGADAPSTVAKERDVLERFLAHCDQLELLVARSQSRVTQDKVH
jgi:hypothetical protein